MNDGDVLKEFNELLSKNIDFNKLSHSYLFETNYYDISKLGFEFIKKIIAEKYSNLSLDELFLRENIIVLGEDSKNIKVNEINYLQEKFSRKAMDNNPYFYIVYNAENLSVNSANKLLKFLEEPEGDIYAILITKNKNSVLKTIVSRCQSISFNINKNEFINQKNEYIDLLFQFICKVSENKETAIAYLNKDFYDKFEDRIFLYKYVNDLQYVYNDILHYLLLNKINYFNEYNEKIINLSKNESYDKINKKILILNDMINILKYNPNIKLFFDKLIIRLSGVDRNE